jgi:hypothetical protein
MDDGGGEMAAQASESRKIAELELRLECRALATYLLAMRFERPDDDAINDPLEGAAVTVALDFDALAQKSADAAAYGRCLTERLFGSEEARAAFRACRTEARSAGWLLRTRLAIGASAPELHGLRWETLRDPDDEQSLLVVDQWILFSRFVHTGNDRRVRPGSSRDERRALVVVASPHDQERWGLSPIDVEAELERARSSLTPLGFEVETLARTSVDGSPDQSPVTLEAICERLGKRFDVLYLVAHGGRSRQSLEPWIALEDQCGAQQEVPALELAGRLRQLVELPLLAVLVSCQSAGAGGRAQAGSGEALAALAPRIVAAGVPAVIGMQGNISMNTVEQLMPAFFRELDASNGSIDRALTAARAVVQHEPDCWMPVLYLHLKSGRLWYEPGLEGSSSSIDPWPSLIWNLQSENCVAILGPELSERVLGTRREIARRWVDELKVPLIMRDQDDLAQVAQYLAVVLGADKPSNMLVTHIRRELRRRYAGDNPELAQASIARLLTVVSAQLRASDPLDPHWILANLPIQVYITASPGSLLTEALRAAGRDPTIVAAPWNSSRVGKPLPPRYRPSVESPLVYHALGHFDDPSSLVITEDNFIQYLIGVTTRHAEIPARINRAIAEGALLFLGFSPEDWAFRVLFSTIMSQEGQAAINRQNHVAVQVSPDERRPESEQSVRRYLETYLTHRVFQGRFSVYWGRAADFLGELLDQWPELKEKVLAPAATAGRQR